jgi:hypothetical protein
VSSASVPMPVGTDACVTDARVPTPLPSSMPPLQQRVMLHSAQVIASLLLLVVWPGMYTVGCVGKLIPVVLGACVCGASLLCFATAEHSSALQQASNMYLPCVSLLFVGSDHFVWHPG